MCHRHRQFDTGPHLSSKISGTEVALAGIKAIAAVAVVFKRGFQADVSTSGKA